MTRNSSYRKMPFLLAAAAILTSSSLAAQQEELPASQAPINVYGSTPTDLSNLTDGPDVKGLISARNGERMQITGDDGSSTVVFISDATAIKASGGFLGLNRDKLPMNSLLNGLPVTIETKQWSESLVASKITLRTKDLKTASMIRTGTAQGFAEQTAATEALRSRVGDIDKYNVKGTTNVYFDVGKANISSQAQAELCATASQADTMDNALVLVVGYADATGDYDFNQELSEKRASRVVNFLQQACGWKPYRMLTPTGMSEADPFADNSTPEGRQQNRRVAVNILVSKGLDGL